MRAGFGEFPGGHAAGAENVVIARSFGAYLVVVKRNQFKICSYSAQPNEPVKTGATHVSMLVGRTVQRNADRYDRIRHGLSSGRQMSAGMQRDGSRNPDVS